VRRLWISAIPLLVAATLLWADGLGVVVKLAEFKAATVSGKMRVSWRVTEQTGVRRFILERKAAGEEQFREVFQTPPNPTGNYEFIDEDLARSGLEGVIKYQLLVEGPEGRLFLKQIDANYTTTAVRRTWGSIKAMFQM
jgi:hypothetical protein